MKCKLFQQVLTMTGNFNFEMLYICSKMIMIFCITIRCRNL